jgi:hypothetical protein
MRVVVANLHFSIVVQSTLLVKTRFVDTRELAGISLSKRGDLYRALLKLAVCSGCC